VPTFPFPDTAARVFAAMWRYAYNLRGLYETPTLPADRPGLPDRDAAAAALAPLAPAGRTRLREHEAKALLAAYGVPAVETAAAATLDEARLAARHIGYPVAVKLLSDAVTHKRAAGGVVLNVRDDEALEEAFSQIRSAAPAGAFDGVTVQRMALEPGVELLVGAAVDPDFGPVLSFGAGGRLAEIHDDVAFGLPPLNTTLARRMMEQTRVGRSLDGPTVEAVAEMLVRFSQLITEWPRVRDLEVNPLLAVDGGGLLALDARGTLHPADLPAGDLPRPAIRAYPSEFVEEVLLADGRRATVRPIRPEDEPLLVRFHEELGEETVYLRYASLMRLERRVAHERLARRCFIDYDREMALVVEVEDDGQPALLAIGRLSKLPGGASGEFGLLVLDRAQGTGIGTIVLERLVRYGRGEGLERIVAEILARNRPMQRVAQKVGFTIIPSEDISDPTVQAVLELSD
jgi:acetyltransferase